MSASIGHLVMWRLFFDVYNSASSTTLKIKLLTHSGHGSVSCLSSDIPDVYECSASVARVITLRRISGSRQLTSANSCRDCYLSSAEPESLERHSVTCAFGIFRHLIHNGIVLQLVAIIKEAGFPGDNIKIELRGMRPLNDTRDLGILWLWTYSLVRATTW